VLLDASVIGHIPTNLSRVRDRIAAAAVRAGRDPGQVTLVAVSKLQPIAAIETAYAAGQRDFGENRLEELLPKAEEAHRLGLSGLRWHMIGTVQSRKSKLAVGPWELIHALDRMKLAQRLSRDALEAGCVMPALLEVNVSGEESKHGFSVDEVMREVEALAGLDGLHLRGLMTMAPLVEDAEEARPVFRSLRELRDRLTSLAPSREWRELSMGMTNDFEVAVEEGATLVRIGSAIFSEAS
jgi:PLP dependent protein